MTKVGHLKFFISRRGGKVCRRILNSSRIRSGWKWMGMENCSSLGRLWALWRNFYYFPWPAVAHSKSKQLNVQTAPAGMLWTEQIEVRTGKTVGRQAGNRREWKTQTTVKRKLATTKWSRLAAGELKAGSKAEPRTQRPELRAQGSWKSGKLGPGRGHTPNTCILGS